MLFQSLLKRPRSVLVSGSGRSGTSLMMGCISHNYKNTGTKPVFRDDTSNPKGFFEDADINFLNDRILETSGVTLPGDKKDGREYRHGGWINKQKITELKINPGQITQIKQFTYSKPFCYKDPRFSFTYPLWKELIDDDDLVLIVIFRHPSKTAVSIIKEPTPKKIHMTYKDALEIWYRQYSNIFDFNHEKGKILYIHYDQILRKELGPLERLLNIKVNYGFIDPKLNRSAERDVPKKYKEMYDLLISKSNYLQ